MLTTGFQTEGRRKGRVVVRRACVVWKHWSVRLNCDGEQISLTCTPCLEQVAYQCYSHADGRYINRSTCAVAQAVSRRALTLEPGVRARVSPYGISGWQTVTHILLRLRFFLVNISFHQGGHHTHVSPDGETVSTCVAAVKRHSPAPSTWTATTKNMRLYQSKVFLLTELFQAP
jgi:hypothetical protein